MTKILVFVASKQALAQRIRALAVSDYLASNALNILGITLAVLDFTGASRRLEAVLARYVEHERKYAQEARAEILTTNLGYHKDAFIRFLPNAFVFAAFITIVWIGLGDQNRLLWLADYLPSWSYWSAILWGPALIAVWYIFDHLTCSIFGYAKSVLLWWPIWLLSRPKAGIVGTLGLLITVLSSVL